MPFLSIPHGQNLNIFSPSYCLTTSVYCTCVKLNSWNNWINLTNRDMHLPERQSCKTILCIGVTHKTLHIQCVFTVHIIFSICIVYACMYCPEPLKCPCLADGVSWLCSTGGLDWEPLCLWQNIMCHLRKISSKIHHLHTLRGLLLSSGNISHYHNIEYKRLNEKTIFMSSIWLKRVGRNL